MRTRPTSLTCRAVAFAWLFASAAALLPHRLPTGSLAPVQAVYASRLAPPLGGGALVGGYLALNSFAPLLPAQVRSRAACGALRS